ncbi:MAG: SLOG family protein [Clostridiales bacterium]|nr:SLOG family protein [Clostridiales bacterium]
MKTCCFTGHRPQFFPWKDNLSDTRAKKLIVALNNEIRLAINAGYTRFLWGGALGVDTWAAECVLSAKESNLNIKLTAVLPYKEYNNFVTDLRYLNAINNSDEIITVGEIKSMRMLKMRDRYMIDNSGRIIAVYDERSKIKSGTYHALCYAKERNIEIKQIRWMDF